MVNSIRVLLVDDDIADAHLTKTLLNRDSHFTIHNAVRLSDAVELLDQRSFDVLLLDLGLPDSTGLETLARIRRSSREIPILVLTGLSDEETALQALDEGAQDYIVKNMEDRNGLVRSVRFAIQRQSLLTQLQESTELLERKNRRLSTLYKMAHDVVDNVSHEFRTPLTVIKEYVSLLRDGFLGDVNEEQYRFLNIVEDRADDLNTMVNDMLDSSRLEAGLLGVIRKECHFIDILSHVRPALERKAEVRGVSLEVVMPDRMSPIYCDPEKVSRVIINLVVNAIKYCDDRGLVVLWAEDLPAQKAVQIGVTDNGPGIELHSVRVIFERFKQIDRDIQRSTKGFGLGLSIAKELVDLNLGEMDVDSTVGKGSTFSFTVPYAIPEEVVRRHLDRIEPQQDSHIAVSIVQASVDETLDPFFFAEAGGFLNYALRSNDLMFPLDKSSWIIILTCSECEVEQALQRFKDARQEENRNRLRSELPIIDFEVIDSFRATDSVRILNTVRSLLAAPAKPQSAAFAAAHSIDTEICAVPASL